MIQIKCIIRETHSTDNHFAFFICVFSIKWYISILEKVPCQIWHTLSNITDFNVVVNNEPFQCIKKTLYCWLKCTFSAVDSFNTKKWIVNSNSLHDQQSHKVNFSVIRVVYVGTFDYKDIVFIFTYISQIWIHLGMYYITMVSCKVISPTSLPS